MRFRVLKEFFIPIPKDPRQNFVVFVEEGQLEAYDAAEALELAKVHLNVTAPIVEPV